MKAKLEINGFSLLIESFADKINTLKISIYKKDEFLHESWIHSENGSTTCHETSYIIDDGNPVICCGDSVFCLEIPSLDIKWKTKADDITAFQIFQIHDSYIIHGELAISKLSKKGEIVWQNFGRNIFVSLTDESNFKIEDEIISAVDFLGNKYQ